MAGNADTLKARLLEVFQFSKELFQQHGLRYIGCGGTVLGAVRHKGFIPWDDDIDIYAKIADLKSTVWEFKHLPFLFGVSIDIFPLDEFDEPDEVITARQYRSHYFFDKYLNAVSHYSFADMMHSLCKGDVHRLGVQVLSKWRNRNPQKYLQAFQRFEEGYKHNGEGPKCVCVTQWEGRIFQSKWFKDVIEVPFEDTTLIIPRDYDAYLKTLYGDYMQLPPEEKRISHPHYFLDLNNRLTLSEARQRLAT